jgi:pimeloyl-ACP methyl ester carboxylesterase
MVVKTHDGLLLDVYSNDLDAEKDTVVFINALGVDSEITRDLSGALVEKGYNFVTWSRRGFPGAYDDRFRDYTVQEQVDDLKVIVSALNLESIILVAWCTGIQIALVAASQYDISIERMIFFNTPNFFNRGAQGLTGDAIGQVCRMLVADEKKLDFLYQNIVAHNTQAVQDKLARVENRRYQQMIQAPFNNGKNAFLRFAHLVNTTHKFKIDRNITQSILCPTLIVGGKKDDMVSWEESVALAELIPNAQYKIFDDWGHYNLFTDAEYVSDNLITKPVEIS